MSPLATPELTVVIPTLNERGNIPVLVERLDRVLAGVNWEAVFVDDDSHDGTLGVLHQLARRDPRIRYIHRIGRAGLSSACLEGLASSSAPFLAVMDADLQHDEALLPRMLAALRGNQADLVVGSRYAEGGGVGEWSRLRQKLSRFATGLAKCVLRVRLEDPMSVFFMLTRDLYLKSVRQVSGQGFKLLLDIVASTPGALRVKELPYEFRAREAGDSKLDSLVLYEYALLLADKLFGRFIPIRFLVFCAVGCFGAIMHLGVLGLLLYAAGRDFVFAQAVATIFAMTVNFTLNNIFTYRAQKLKGRRLITGLLFFYAVCAMGAFANIRVAEYLFNLGAPWWGAGLLGAILGAVWNYGVSSILVWSKRSRSRAGLAEVLDPDGLGRVEAELRKAAAETGGRAGTGPLPVERKSS